MNTERWWEILAIFTLSLRMWGDMTAVEIPPEVRQPPMIIKQSVRDYIVEPIDPIIVECEATGNPTPIFTWTRNGVYLNVARDPQVTMKRRSGTLEIFFWGRPEDYEGVYQCSAVNEFGTALSSHINLRVSKARTWLKEYLEPVSVFVGRPLILPCNPPAGPPQPQTYWMNSSMVPIPQDRRVSMAVNGDLIFSSIVAEDAFTNYVCTARFPHSNSIQQKPPLILQVHTARMAAHTAPKFIKPKGIASAQIAMLGEELILECFASGVPAPTIKWTKNWVALPINGMKLENFNKILRLKNVSMEDQGDYICTASNKIGSLDHTISVRVKATPFWVEKPESLVLPRDDSGRIVCQADGIPRPQIQWLVNGQPFEDAPKSPGREVSGDTLIFNSVVPDSTAVFQCNASNQYGYILANAFLAVIDMKPRLLGVRDEIIKVSEGSRALLHCPYFGSPKPNLRWTKDGITLEGGRYRVHSNGTLEIKRTKLQDQGTLLCAASNVIGKDEMEVVFEVKEPTKIIEAPRNVTVLRGNLATFDCKIQTDPTLDVTVTWFKDKTFLILGRRMTKDEDSLSIANVYRRDEGIYTCRVKTEVEEISASAKLTVMDRPDPPTDLELSDTSERSARLTWVPGLSNHSPIKAYLVQYTEDLLADYWLVPSGWKNLTSYPGYLNSVILQLKPFVEYQFRVIAVNSVGPSRPSKPSMYYETGGAVPDAIPKNIKGVGTGVFRNNMEISWEPLEYSEWNGPKLGYVVWWKRQGSYEEWKNYTTYWWCSHIIYETDTFMPYEIKVQAVNFFGLGPESPVVIGYSGEDRPIAAPTDLQVSDVESTTLTVNWQPVPPASIMGVFQEYTVYYWRESSRLPYHSVSSRIKTKSFKANGSSFSGTLTGLIPYSNYKMYIVVANTRYEGPPSPRIGFQTLEGVPSVPRSFRIMHRHYDTIYLDWKEPAEPNGILTGYILKYQTLNVSAAERIQVEDIPPNTTHFSLRRFDRYTRYKFTLAAQTEVGVGEPFTEESPHFTTDEYSQEQVDIVTQGWFIGLMCAIALLVLIMLTVFFIKKTRGGKYPVRKKQDFSLDHLDDKEEGSFDYRSLPRITRTVPTLPYSRREEEIRLGRSQGHMQQKTGSDDSLMEYGEGDEIEFNEDGSFIGEYTGINKKDRDSGHFQEHSETTSPVAMYSFT